MLSLPLNKISYWWAVRGFMHTYHCQVQTWRLGLVKGNSENNTSMEKSFFLKFRRNFGCTVIQAFS